MNEQHMRETAEQVMKEEEQEETNFYDKYIQKSKEVEDLKIQFQMYRNAVQNCISCLIN